MTPADKRLHPHDPARFQIQLGLVMEKNLLTVQGLAQAVFNGQPLGDPLVHGRGENPIGVLAAFLGAVHGGVRVLDQGVLILPVFGIEGDAQADGEIELLPLDADHRGQPFDDSLRGQEHIFFLLHSLE